MRGFREEICFGGGLHAIYGTNGFRHSIMTEGDKSVVVAEFGEYAEHLAYLFSILDQPRTLQSPLELDLDAAIAVRTNKQMLKLRRGIFDDLRKIECANLIDQNFLEKYYLLSETWNNLAAQS
jgi:hypothetical protein